MENQPKTTINRSMILAGVAIVFFSTLFYTLGRYESPNYILSLLFAAVFLLGVVAGSYRQKQS